MTNPSPDIERETVRIRKWWQAGHEVTIRLTGYADEKRLHQAVHAFSLALKDRPHG